MENKDEMMLNELEDEVLLTELAIQYRVLQACMKVTYEKIYVLAHKLKPDVLLS
jgi:hypothetical protein